MAVALGVGEALEDEHADALRPAGAVGRLGEGLAAPVGGEAALAAELDEDAGGGEDGHPAGQGQRALAAAQRLGGQVHRHQRGGAGGVDGDRRALEAEGVGDAAGDDAAGAAGQPVALQLRRDAALAVVAGASTPAKTPVWLPRSEAGSMPASSSASQEASSSSRCWGSIASASRGLMPKKLGVELGGVGEEAALAGVAGAGVVGVGVVEALEVPAAVGGELGDRVAALGDQLPELLGGGDPAGVAAGHADDRDRLLACLGADRDLLGGAARASPRPAGARPGRPELG